MDLPDTDLGARWQRTRLALIAENAKLPTTEAHSPAWPGDPRPASQPKPAASEQQNDDPTPPNAA